MVGANGLGRENAAKKLHGWWHMGSAQMNQTIGHVILAISNATSVTGPGAPIVGVDFVRFYETDNFLF